MGRFEADNGVFRLSFTATLFAAALPACISRFQTKLAPITPPQISRADRRAAAPSPSPGTGKSRELLVAVLLEVTNSRSGPKHTYRFLRF